MHKLKIFLASPISGFQDEKQYASYRESVISLITALSDTYEVHSEVQSIESIESYDTPEESLREDFLAITEADIFLFLHPMRMQTSSLIELGYACALKKTILIVSEPKNLPYMVLGITKPFFNAASIQSSEINSETIANIIDVLASLRNSR